MLIFCAGQFGQGDQYRLVCLAFMAGPFVVADMTCSITKINVCLFWDRMCVPLSRLVANLQSRQCCDRACFGFPQDLVQVTTTSFRPSDGKSCQNGCTKTNIRPILHAERRNVKDAGNQNITKHRDTMMCLISLIKNAALDSVRIRYPPYLRLHLRHSPKRLHN